MLKLIEPGVTEQTIAAEADEILKASDEKIAWRFWSVSPRRPILLAFFLAFFGIA
jgi:hypothetical protein